MELYEACQEGNTERVKNLLEDANADPNKGDTFGWTPFYKACYNGCEEIVELLLNDARIDPNKGTNNGKTPLQVACEENEITVMRYLRGHPRVRKETNGEYSHEEVKITKHMKFIYACADGDLESLREILIWSKKRYPKKN